MLHLLQDVSSRLLPLDKLLQIIFTALEVRRFLPELGPLHQAEPFAILLENRLVKLVHPSDRLQLFVLRLIATPVVNKAS